MKGKASLVPWWGLFHFCNGCPRKTLHLSPHPWRGWPRSSQVHHTKKILAEHGSARQQSKHLAGWHRETAMSRPAQTVLSRPCLEKKMWTNKIERKGRGGEGRGEERRKRKKERRGEEKRERKAEWGKKNVSKLLTPAHIRKIPSRDLVQAYTSFLL